LLDEGNLTLSCTPDTAVISLKEYDLTGVALQVTKTKAVIFLPPGNLSHILGSLDPVASPAQDLEIIPCPLFPSHGDWPDVVKDVVMMDMWITLCVGFMDHLPAPGTLPTLLIADTPSHFRDRGPLFIPVLQCAGSLAAESMLMSRCEVYSLAAAMGTGTPGKPLLFFRSILAIFPYYHSQIPPSLSCRLIVCTSCARPDNTEEDGVKVFQDKGI
jgi:hypothetical protein